MRHPHSRIATLAATVLIALTACSSTSSLDGDDSGSTSSSSADSSSTSSTTSGATVKPYPLNTCIVTDNELGSMGEIVTKTYGDQEVKFCCKPCVKKFEANPTKFLAKLPR